MPKDGYKLKVSVVFSDFAELMGVVFEEVARQLAPQELSIVPPRSITTFVDVTLNQHGIGNAQERFSWQEIQEVMTVNGAATIRKKAEKEDSVQQYC